MDMFLLFVVIFTSVLFGVGLSALMLSLLFKLILKLSSDRAREMAVTPAPVPTQAPQA
jgi:multisubunit Na+/H+ antiporter MnhC subunit